MRKKMKKCGRGGGGGEIVFQHKMYENEITYNVVSIFS